MSYDHRSIEATWQAYWQRHDTFATPTDRSRPKYYVLDMFPYPSGEGLHVGHPKGYVATDVVARARRMMGYNVLRVMGWDSFGLPAERQAVREGRHPREITQRNIATFKGQLERLGLSYDWSRELATSDPDYYRWTQWIFLKLYEQGLAYQADVSVNWCAALGTVLANEEVKDGVYIETGDPVEPRTMRQWMLRITAYADRLLEQLEGLQWPDGIKQMQRNWIGRSVGAEVAFGIEGSSQTFAVFTTRPDTLFGCTYVVFAPEHPMVAQVTTEARRREVEAYVAEASRRSERERISQAIDDVKSGAFTGAYALNPVNGARVPIWIADFVVASYGTGAVFACPGHDDRDHAFAKAFDLPIVEVVAGGDVQESAYLGDGPHVSSDFLDGLLTDAAKERVIDYLEEKGAGRASVQYRLRDWLFSRQRYWGEPFPVIHAGGEVITLPVEQLPLELPELDDYRPTADGRPPLARAEQWLQTVDPASGEPARRETNTMPQWAGSCWYYLRFISPHLTTAAWDADEERYWMPVDLYVGGAEHATLHLLYARFWHHVLYDIGAVSTPEPFQRLYNQGMVHATSFRDGRGKYHYPDQVVQKGGRWFDETGEELQIAVEKMSKSKYNGVNPDEICADYGADSMRLYELFMGPLDEGVLWETAGVAGVRRFLDRAWRVAFDDETDTPTGKVVDAEDGDRALHRALHSAIKMVSEAVESLKFNTAISAMMVFVNEATRVRAVPRTWFLAFLRILGPFAPHVAEELWHRLGEDGSIADATWPEYDAAALVDELVTIAVQVNGKVRATLEVAAGTERDVAIAQARELPNVARHLDGKDVVKEIHVPDRLVNLVARP